MEKEHVYTVIKVSALISFFIFIYFYYKSLKKDNAFEMNAGKLTDQRLFWASILAPAYGFITFGIVAWLGHSIQLDSAGFNNFLEISKLPLAILSLSGFLGIIVNNIHRTIQTDTQIKEAQRKNKIDAFYAHRKNTIEILQNLDFSHILILNEVIELTFQNCYSTYKKIYPFASTNRNDFSPSQKFISKSERLWLKLCNLLKNTNFPTQLEYFNHLLLIDDTLYEIHIHYGFKILRIDQLYNRTFTNEDNIKYEFRTTLRDEHNLKLNIAAYWLAHLAISELMEVEFTTEFKKATEELYKYPINTEEKYGSWATANLVTGSAPKISIVEYL
ncbi:hypothetical protein AW40_18205 [Kosakonia radicincitans UMEnt01/12]|uniref:hypothetical protein n=1 Tax=Kosakonia radicincitans TaxID=283686 RepID=UPI0004613A27|nr:hypothetical protein [Kosakonia radicincitans]KDE35100.1 hypothetical protein AW40_18205 [Kosakonia radicincitans UMEnt01/12]